MAKRRANVVDSDGEEHGSGGSAPKRTRFDEGANEHIQYAPEPTTNGESSRSKKKRSKKANDVEDVEDDDIEPVNLDDLHESQQAQDEATTSERFEQEHEEAIRQSIRNREKLSGVCSTLLSLFLTCS